MKKIIDDIKSARWAIILIIAYFVLFRRIIYTICPVVLVTGYPCPGCGMTRAALRLFRFDFVGAWEMHPFIYAVVLLGVIFCVNRYFLSEKYNRQLKVLIVVTALAMIMFYIWRMYTMFPHTSPMIYYDRNCLKNILNILTYLRIV